MAGVTRLELAASGVTGRRSNQTELHPPFMYYKLYIQLNKVKKRNYFINCFTKLFFLINRIVSTTKPRIIVPSKVFPKKGIAR